MYFFYVPLLIVAAYLFYRWARKHNATSKITAIKENVQDNIERAIVGREVIEEKKKLEGLRSTLRDAREDLEELKKMR